MGVRADRAPLGLGTLTSGAMSSKGGGPDTDDSGLNPGGEHPL